MRLRSSPPPVDACVGFASYTGYPKSHDYYASFALLAASVLVPLSVWRLLARNRPLAYLVKPSSRWSTRWAQAVVLVLLLLYFQPNLTDGLAALKTWQYQYGGWDDQHALSWAYMINDGLR